MRPQIKTQFFEDIQSFNQFAIDLLAGKIILCETLQDCATAVRHIDNGLYDHNKADVITLFIMPELQLQLLKHKAEGDMAVKQINDLISMSIPRAVAGNNSQ